MTLSPKLSPVFSAQMVWGFVGHRLLIAYIAYILLVTASQKIKSFSSEDNEAAPVFGSILSLFALLLVSHWVSKKAQQMATLNGLRRELRGVRRRSNEDIEAISAKMINTGIAQCYELAVILAAKLLHCEELKPYLIIQVGLKDEYTGLDHTALVMIKKSKSKLIKSFEKSCLKQRGEIRPTLEKWLKYWENEEIIIADPWYQVVFNANDIKNNPQHARRYPMLLNYSIDVIDFKLEPKSKEESVTSQINTGY